MTQDLPTGWVSMRVKHRQTKIGSGKTPSGGSSAYVDEGVPFIRSLNVYDDGFRDKDLVYISRETDAEMSASRVRSNDVLLNITGASIGRSCLAPVDLLPANVNQHVCIIRPMRSLLPAYLAYVLKSAKTKNAIQAAQNGASREGLNFGQVGDIPLDLPSLPTQRAIADFLDRKTAAIDALIEKKERLLELLAEKRAALIHRAVTKGLDPSVPMKDSGVPWIGEIPEHWEVVQLRRVLATLDQGWSPSALDRPKEDHEWGVLKLSAVRDGEYRPEFHKTLPDDLEPRPEFIPRVKDLLVSRANTPDMVGESCVVDQVDPRMMLCDLLYRLRLERKRAIPGFVDLFIRSASGKAFRKTDARGTSHSMVKLSQGHTGASTHVDEV